MVRAFGPCPHPPEMFQAACAYVHSQVNGAFMSAPVDYSKPPPRKA